MLLLCMVVFGAGVGGGAGTARAQQNTTDESRFREIQVGSEDISPQAVSNTFRWIDMRTPIGFDRVYEVLDSPGLLARRSGSVTAVFPRSVYAGNGTPLIPPGTVFYIGPLPVRLQGQGVLANRMALQPKLTGQAMSERSQHTTSTMTSAKAASANARAVPFERVSIRADRQADRFVDSGAADAQRDRVTPVRSTESQSQFQSPSQPELAHTPNPDSSLRAQSAQRSLSIFTSEAYRRQRLAVLIDKASANRRAGGAARAAHAPKSKP